ncbi:hypothetical protein [Parasediminibacterium sp. JCM 36343]|uniref:hypothetical protein n=1 Tax=Parasediminibacterium sp. JCM 36343 TaxID=3374279 RepID=UPI00397DF913
MCYKIFPIGISKIPSGIQSAASIDDEASYSAIEHRTDATYKLLPITAVPFCYILIATSICKKPCCIHIALAIDG